MWHEGLIRLCAALLLALGGTPSPTPGVPAKLPDTAAGRHATAWLEAFNSGDEAAMRTMYGKHFAAQALAQRSLDDRIGLYRESRGRFGKLSPARVVEADDSFVRLVARGAGGEFWQLDFVCEGAAPFALMGVRLESIDGPEAAEPRGPAFMAEELPSRFDAYLTERANAGEFAGVVLLARRGVPVLHKAYGLAERRFGVPNRLDTRFNLGSVNKAFTKLAIAQLVEQGKLRLDDTLGRWLPDWPGSGGKITIEQLVEHRAGVTDFFNGRYRQMDRSALRHNRDYVALFRDDTLWFEPGTSQRYSNGGYVLLGEIVGKASGEDYYDYVRQHILEPAGMKDTGWFEADDPAPNVAMGYYREDDGKGPVRENTFTRPARGSAAGGGYSTAEDLLRFEQALIGAKLAGAGWSRWVVGGPTPGTAAAEGSSPAPSFVLMGGAPGITASLGREGDWTLIVLSNLDRSMMPRIEDRLQQWLRRVKE